MNSQLFVNNTPLKKLVFWVVSIIAEVLCLIGAVYFGGITTLLMFIVLAGLMEGESSLYTLFPLGQIIAFAGCLVLLVKICECQRDFLRKNHKNFRH